MYVDGFCKVRNVHIWYTCAVCCSVLQCVAVCCSVLQCVAVCCSVLHCVYTIRYYSKSVVGKGHDNEE